MLRHASLGLVAAALMASIGGERAFPVRPQQRRKRFFEAEFIPNDHGPVIDTTPESKRARRRRLAKSKS